jgi:hypothetical protein
LPPETTTHVNFNVMAKDHEGKPLTPAVKPLSIDDSWFKAAEKAEVAAPATEAAIDVHHEVANHEEANHEAGAEHHEPTVSEQHPSADVPKTNWLLVSGILLAINLFLGVSGFFIYRYLKKSQAEKHQQLLERLS